MKQFLYRIQPTRAAMLTEGPTGQEASLISAHFAYLKDLLLQDKLLLAGRTLNTDDSSFGVVIFQAESDSEALVIMQNDPAVRGGVMQAALFPYAVALWSQRGPDG